MVIRPGLLVSIMHFSGVVLAGGQSRRFGSDKAQAQYQHSSMLQRAVALLRAVCPDVFVVTQADRSYLEVDADIIHDIVPECGPLGGLYTATRFCKTSFMLVLTCDMPCVSPEMLQELLVHHDRNVLVSSYQAHPFPGIYARSLESQLKQTIATQDYRVRAFLNKIPQRVQLPARDWESELVNINSPQDLQELEQNLSPLRSRASPAPASS